MRTLIIPGYKSSLEGHWQHWLLEAMPGCETVYQEDWENPKRAHWVDRLSHRIASYGDEPVLLIAHSMGSVTVAAMVADTKAPKNIIGALIVAPADSENDYLPDEIEGFAPMPQSPFPFPATFIGSENDPYMSFERAQLMAQKWQCEFINLGAKGHINTDAGFGPWPEVIPIIEKLKSKK